MLKQIMAASKRKKKPLDKNALQAIFLWQMAFLGAGLFFGILDLAGVMRLSQSALLPFIFLPLGFAVVAYMDVQGAGMEPSDTKQPPPP